MARRADYWLCPGCSHRNVRAHVKCRGEGCGRSRPKRRVAKHALVLRDTPYDRYAALSVQIHGGDLDACAVCRRPMNELRRHDRDHDHRTGLARGLACFRCNRELLRNTTLEEARMVVAYLERVEAHYEREAVA